MRCQRYHIGGYALLEIIETSILLSLHSSVGAACSCVHVVAAFVLCFSAQNGFTTSGGSLPCDVL
jgi:hypothetical protein